MGNKGSKPELKKREIAGYVASTRMDPEEVKALYMQFLSIKTSESEDEEITVAELQRALGFSRAPSLFVERIFAMFDSNHDGKLTFSEFVTGVSLLSNAPPKDRVRFSFNIYNASGDGFITKEELGELLSRTLMENDVNLLPSQIRSIVDGTFMEADLNGDGRIDFAEYEIMVSKNPSILKPLTLNLSEILQLDTS